MKAGFAYQNFVAPKPHKLAARRKKGMVITMKYKINRSNYRDFQTISENRLPHRSYFIPFGSEERMRSVSYLDERAQSDRVLFLSGEWEFAYFQSAAKLPDTLDTDRQLFDPIHVPSTWQKTGYDKINYLNSMYPFRCNPPKTPKNCPVGVYRKTFPLENRENDTYFITFLGVASSLDVYLNGKYVGYGEGSHNSREFDITPFLQNGENELVAVVYKWSTGTYLECQDMFRENGIFRDVYITCQPESYLYDFCFEKQKAGGGYRARITADIRGGKTARLQAKLLFGEKTIAEQTVWAGEPICWESLAVEEWSAENPVCYDLILSVSDGGRELQCVRQKVGFCTIELDGCRYLFNGQPVKFKGVNHHDTHPVRGYAMTVKDLLRDIELMKAYHVNCVRTSHYPPDPLMLTMCDVYGLYVVDEADLETHGCFVKNMDLISDDPKWEAHYLDRIQALYERDKNHPSIVMWSMGNEAGGIRNFDACYEYLKTKTEIPVHYEPACRSERVRYDILAYFYTPPEEMRALSRGEWTHEKDYDAPFFLCEYAHSMGVGPGGLEEYWEVIYSDERFLGGCIWEWADHAHYDAQAKYKYTYGGDHKDRLNSGNFCCDGLFYPDRTPSPSALCMKNVYRPLRASLKNGELWVRNTNYFRSSAGVGIACSLLRNGVLENRRVFDLEIAPQASVWLPYDFYITDHDDAFLILQYIERASGREIAKEQIILQERFPTAAAHRVDLPWREEDSQIALARERAEFRFDQHGNLAALKDRNGRAVLPENSTGFALQLWQAVIDNHVYAAAPARKLGLNRLRGGKRKRRFDRFQNTVTTSFALKARGKPRFAVEILQKAVSETAVQVTLRLTSRIKQPVDLLQIGLTLTLNGRYQNVRYYGMGETESYSDFSAQDVMGVYRTTVPDMFVPYIKPQESGNRSGVRWAEITDDAGGGLRLTALEQPLHFKAVDVSEENLRKARHREDVERLDQTVLHINGFMRGIGSQSCGPDTAEPFKKLLHFGETAAYSFLLELL